MSLPTSPQTSFIPRKSLATSAGTSKVRNGVNFFLLVGVILFILSIVAGGLVYGWRLSLESKIKKQAEYIAGNEKNFDSDLLDRITRVNQRLSAGADLLSKHISLSSIFNIIGDDTIQSVRFKSFGYALDEKGMVKLNLTGVGENFNSIALQSDRLNTGKNLKNPIMSGFVVNEDGTVSFNLTADIPLKAILYKK